MALIYINYSQSNTEILKYLKTLKQQIMGKFDDLQDRVAALQSTVDAEQADIQALLEMNAQVVADLKDDVAALEAQIAEGATAEQLQTVVDSINATIEDVESTVADVSTTSTTTEAPDEETTTSTETP